MKRKQWVQLGLVASKYALVNGILPEYQRQSSPKEAATRADFSKNKQKKADNKQLPVFSYQKILPLQKI